MAPAGTMSDLGSTSLADTVAAMSSSCAAFCHRFGSLGVSLLVVLLVAELLLYKKKQAQRRKDLPPGPSPWPILGNLTQMAGSHPHRHLQKMASKFGGLMYLRMGSVPCVVVSTAEAARKLFGPNDEKLLSRPKMLSFEIISDNYTSMVFAPVGKLWSSLRKLGASQLFSPMRVASYEGTRAEELSNMLTVLQKKSEKGEPVNLKVWLYEVNANMMLRMLVNKRLFGRGVTSEDEKLKEEFQFHMDCGSDIVMPVIISDYIPALSFFTETVQGKRAKIEAYRRNAYSLGVKLLEVEKHRQRAAERQKNDSDYVPDFVDVMLNSPLDNGKVPPDRQISMIVLEFFAAGVETSSTTVEWALAELFVHPELMERAQKEIGGMVSSDRLVQESDIPNLPFLQAVVKETFRVHPPAPFGIPRESTEEAEALGYKIPAKTRIMVNFFAIMRDPSVYENPNEFNPDRFLHGHVGANHLSGFDSYELIPFGMGRRMCPGYKLANSTVHLMLANLIHRYDWSLPEGKSMESFDMSEGENGVVLCLNEHLVLVPKLRSGAVAF